MPFFTIGIPIPYLQTFDHDICCSIAVTVLRYALGYDDCCGAAMPFVPYGNRDYLGQVDEGGVMRLLLVQIFGAHYGIDDCRFILNGRARMFSFLPSALGIDRPGTESLIALCGCARGWDLGQHLLHQFHMRIMEVARLGLSPLGHVARAFHRQQDEDSSDDEF